MLTLKFGNHLLVEGVTMKKPKISTLTEYRQHFRPERVTEYIAFIKNSFRSEQADLDILAGSLDLLLKCDEIHSALFKRIVDAFMSALFQDSYELRENDAENIATVLSSCVNNELLSADDVDDLLAVFIEEAVLTAYKSYGNATVHKMITQVLESAVEIYKTTEAELATESAKELLQLAIVYCPDKFPIHDAVSIMNSVSKAESINDLMLYSVRKMHDAIMSYISNLSHRDTQSDKKLIQTIYNYTYAISILNLELTHTEKHDLFDKCVICLQKSVSKHARCSKRIDWVVTCSAVLGLHWKPCISRAEFMMNLYLAIIEDISAQKMIENDHFFEALCNLYIAISSQKLSVDAAKLNQIHDSLELCFGVRTEVNMAKNTRLIRVFTEYIKRQSGTHVAFAAEIKSAFMIAS